MAKRQREQEKKRKAADKQTRGDDRKDRPAQTEEEFMAQFQDTSLDVDR